MISLNQFSIQFKAVMYRFHFGMGPRGLLLTHRIKVNYCRNSYAEANLALYTRTRLYVANPCSLLHCLFSI